MGKIKILLVDDHTLFRHGLKALINNHEDIEVIGEAVNGQEAVNKTEELKPDIVVIDISMPILNGLEATRRIKRISNKIKILILSMYDNEEYIFAVLRYGASGYLLKEAAASDFIEAIRSIYHGDSYLSPSISKKVIEGYLAKKEKILETDNDDKLTGREKEILQLITEGYSNRKISSLLSLSVKTVDAHRNNIMKKLNIHNKSGLVKYAIKKGLIDINKFR